MQGARDAGGTTDRNARDRPLRRQPVRGRRDPERARRGATRWWCAQRTLIAIGGAYGTLSEIAFALKAGKRVVGLGTWDVDGVEAADSPEAAVETVLRDLST